ncbi:MAG: hypothetical protein U1E96_01465 [Azonexus sp.]
MELLTAAMGKPWKVHFSLPMTSRLFSTPWRDPMFSPIYADALNTVGGNTLTLPSGASVDSKVSRRGSD